MNTGVADLTPSAAVPQRLEDVRVALVGYLSAAGGRQERVDLIDARGLATLASLTPADARAIAEQIVQVAGWSVEPRK